MPVHFLNLARLYTNLKYPSILKCLILKIDHIPLVCHVPNLPYGWGKHIVRGACLLQTCHENSVCHQWKSNPQTQTIVFVHFTT